MYDLMSKKQIIGHNHKIILQSQLQKYNLITPVITSWQQKQTQPQCCISPVLSKIYIQEALNKSVTIFDQSVSILLFADDQVVIANDKHDAYSLWKF